MPALRKPTELHRISGQLSLRPQRFMEQGRDTEPTPTAPLGDPPEKLSETEKAMWIEFASEVPPGVAANCDRTLFELAVKLRTIVRSGEGRAADYSNLITCIREMGLTPVTRSKVKATVQKEQDEWDELDERTN